MDVKRIIAFRLHYRTVRIAKHPIKVLDIELSENQYQEFFQYCSHDTD